MALMNKEIGQQWVDDLRSGKYNQGIGYLCQLHNNSNDYCCLGVLAEQALKSGIVDDKRCDDVDYDVDVKAFNGCQSTLPAAIIKWADINPIVLISPEAGQEGFSILVQRGKQRSSLDTLNDNGMSFSKIADLIEEQLLRD